MAFTNRTTNYGLPQWVANDKPTWLSDVNGAFETIDTNLKNVADSSSGLSEDVALLQEQHTQMDGRLSQVNATLNTQAQAITTLQGKDTQHDQQIASVQTIATANANKIGDTPMTTTEQTLTGAIEEVNNKIGLVNVWTNPNPGVAQSPTTLEIDTTPYQALVIVIAYEPNDATARNSQFIPLVPNVVNRYRAMWFGGAYFWRDIIINDNSIVIADATELGAYATAGRTNNSRAIITNIYGIKK